MWLLPSRGRPGNLARFFDAFRRTGGSTPGVVLIGHGDQAAYAQIELPLGWHYALCSRDSQAEKIAQWWDQLRDCAWLGLIGDDCVPMTPGWDRGLIQALDGANIVSCNDGWQAPNRLGNCWVMAGELVRAVGYIFPPGLQHLYVDDVWEEIGRGAQCWTCLMEVLVEHRHVLAGKAAADDTHRLVYGSDRSDPGAGLWPHDSERFARWQRSEAAQAIAAASALREARGETEFRPCSSQGQALTPSGQASLGREARGGPRVVPLIPSSAGDPGAGTLDPQSMARLDYARSRSLMLLTPIHDRPTWQYTVAYAETCVMLEQLRIRYASRFVVGSSNLPKARNLLAARFLASGMTDCLFVDSDMGWSANSVLRLLASDKPVIAGVGRKKVDKPNSDPNVWCCHFEPEAGHRLVQDEMGNVQLTRVGTGFMKISRSVFEQMMAAHPEWKRAGDPEMEPAVRANYYQFFKFDDVTELGEDYYFCERWRELGGTVWIDPSINLSHTGEKSWSGRISEMMEPAPPDPAPLPAAA